MPAEPFESFRSQLARLLELAIDQLGAGDLDHLRFKVAVARRDGLSREVFDLLLEGSNSRVASIGGRLFALLANADEELRPDRVAALEAMIQARLNVGL